MPLPPGCDIRVKRIYDEPGKEGGVRILVDRLWPRGMSKDTVRIGGKGDDIAGEAAEVLAGAEEIAKVLGSITHPGPASSMSKARPLSVVTWIELPTEFCVGATGKGSDGDEDVTAEAGVADGLSLKPVASLKLKHCSVSKGMPPARGAQRAGTGRQPRRPEKSNNRP